MGFDLRLANSMPTESIQLFDLLLSFCMHDNWKEGGVYKDIHVNGVNDVNGLRNANNTKSI
jgi:hypothetical protein